MGEAAGAAPVLVICGDIDLRDSLMDLLSTDGQAATVRMRPDPSRHALVLAASDAWPPGWNAARLESTFREVSCVILSGSPLGGPFAVARLRHGYFLQLPASPTQVLDLVAELVDG